MGDDQPSTETLDRGPRPRSSPVRRRTTLAALSLLAAAALFVALSQSPQPGDEAPAALTRPYSADDLLAGVDLVVDDINDVVHSANFFVGADLQSLQAEVDFTAEDSPTMISFDLALCEQLPLVAVSFDHETQAMNVDVRSQEQPTCEATPAPAIVQLYLEPGVEIRSSSMRVG